MGSRRIVRRSEETSEKERNTLRQMAEEAKRRFAELSEEGQMLYLLAGALGSVREVHSDPGERERHARDFITGRYGPKFAERVMGTPELRVKLKLDVPARAFKPSVSATTRV